MKFTAIYTVSVGHYRNSYPKMIRFEQLEGETILGALNRAGYAEQDAANQDRWDISEATVYLFEGHPRMQGEE
jgi:hypothetical protein